MRNQRLKEDIKWKKKGIKNLKKMNSLENKDNKR